MIQTAFEKVKDAEENGVPASRTKVNGEKRKAEGDADVEGTPKKKGGRPKKSITPAAGESTSIRTLSNQPNLTCFMESDTLNGETGVEQEDAELDRA